MDLLKPVLDYAERLARYYNSEGITSEHLLLALSGSPNQKVQDFFKVFNPDFGLIQKNLEFLSEQDYIGNNAFDSDVLYEMDAINVIQGAKHDLDLLTAIVNIPCHAQDFLISSNEAILGRIEIEDMKTWLSRGTTHKNTRNQPTIKKYCKELSRMAELGELDPVIGREKELEELGYVLGRRRKNNPVVLGEAGTGKTALIEGLALKIYEKDPKFSFLHEKRIVMIDLPLLTAGTKYRGEFEAKLTELIKELEEDPNTIAFIDEVHTIVGAGSAEGSMDASNILKPSLARGRIQIIGATTLKEYNYIKKDAALGRRFQPVVLHKLDEKEVFKIVKGLRKLYEKHHDVAYTEQALHKIVELGMKYEGRQSPDAQIDLLDMSGSMFKGKKIGAREIVSVFESATRSNQDKQKTVGF